MNIESFRNFVLRILRVPAEPSPPAGSPQSVRTFRASKKFYYLLLIRWVFAQVAALAGIIVFLGFDVVANFGKASEPLRLIEWIGLGSFLLQLPFTFLLVRFDYDLRWYIVTDRSLRIRFGLFSVREMTMTFANIQQITIRQGPLQRLLGISDLEVRTAGGGAGANAGMQAANQNDSASGHLGFFRGIENAEEVRDLILARLRQWRDSGLGDSDEMNSAIRNGASPASDEVLAAAIGVLAEARALRATVSHRG